MLSIIKRKYASLICDKRFSEILTGSAMALASKAASVVLGMVSNVIIARFYGAEAMGVLAVVNSLLVLVTIFTLFGTGMSILRIIPEHIVKYSVTSAFHVYRNTQFFVFSISIVTSMLFFFGSRFLATKVFSKPHLSFIFAVASIFIVFKSLMLLNTQAVRGLKLIKTFAFMQSVPYIAMLLLLLASIFLYPNPNNPVYAQLTAWGLTAVVGVLIMDRTFKKRMGPDDLIQSMPISEIASISFPMLMATSMQFFIGQTGVIVLGMFRSTAEVGHYAIAVKLATLTSFILQAINSISAPKFSELYHSGKMDELFYVSRKSTKLIFWTTTPILFALIGLGKPLLSIVFGKEFTVVYPAMVLLVAGQFVNSISGSTGGFLVMCGHQKMFRNILCFAAIINIIFCFLFIPRLGTNGAAFSGMFSLGFWNLYSLYFIKREFGRTIGYVPFFRSAV